MTTKPTKYQMLPYRQLREIDYASLEFDPGVSAEKPDGMRQHLEQWEVLGLLISWFTDFNQRPDVFVDFDSFICYDPANNNVRISPDIYVAFGVDTGAIRPRMIYLPDEVGKPPDWVLEIASESTWREDVNRKPAIYQGRPGWRRRNVVLGVAAHCGILALRSPASPNTGASTPAAAITMATRWPATVWPAALTSPSS